MDRPGTALSVGGVRVQVTSPGLGATFTAFTILYVGLTALTVWSVRRIAARPVEGLPAAAVGAA